MLSDEMFALFTKWRVGAFGRRLREVCEDEACDALSFEEKIELCVEAELEARESRKIEKAVRQARFKIRDACIEEVYFPSAASPATASRGSRRARGSTPGRTSSSSPRAA